MFFGLDIGYGQTKLSYGDKYALPVSEVHPSGAALIELCDRGSGAESSERRSFGAEVLVDGVSYGSLIDPDQLSCGMGVLHAGYVSSSEYRALYYGALSRLRGDVIEHLVTGVPVADFKDKAKLAGLQARLMGKHTIQKGRTVDVRKVSIFPQAAGAFLAHLDRQPLGYGKNDSLLVIDFGHFSVDWVLFVAGNYRDAVSGSLPHGGSVVIDNMRQLIFQKHHGYKISQERIFRYVRSGESKVELGSLSLDLESLKSQAAAQIAPRVMDNILKTLRLEQTEVNRVLLCGGGTPFFVDYVKPAFGHAAVEEIPSAVLANAIGFRLFAQKDS